MKKDSWSKLEPISSHSQRLFAYLLVDVQLPEDLGSVEEVGVVDNSCWS